MSDIESILFALKKFNSERDWEQFHNAKDLAIAISIEANELLELFLWKNSENADKEKIKEEIADIFLFTFLLASKLDLNIKELIFSKLQQNAIKYPIEKAKGKSNKYTDL